MGASWVAARAQRQRVDSSVIGIDERIAANIERLRPALARLKSWDNVLGALDFKYVDVDAKRPGGLLDLAYLQYGGRKTDISDDRDVMEIR